MENSLSLVFAGVAETLDSVPEEGPLGKEQQSAPGKRQAATSPGPFARLSQRRQ